MGVSRRANSIALIAECIANRVLAWLASQVVQFGAPGHVSKIVRAVEGRFG